MSSTSGEVLGFIGEWYDAVPMLTRKFLIKIFVESNSIEIYHVGSGPSKCFLRKSPLQSDLSVDSFNVGEKVLINSRLINLVDYADPYTRRKLSAFNDSNVVVLSPDAYHNMGKIMGDFESEGLRLDKLTTVQLGEAELSELLPLLGIEGPDGQLLSLWTSGVLVAMSLKGQQSSTRVPEMVTSLKSKYAVSQMEGALWTGSGLQDFFFSGARSFATTATFDRATCGVIRPHAVKSGNAPAIIDAVLESGFEITALQMFSLDKTCASEFLEVYQGVIPEYPDTVLELCSGTCIAMEVKAPQASGLEVCSAFRELAGPWDVEMARELKPKSIRAQYGVNRVLNALHCTDLVEDSVPECLYFFDLLQRS